MMKKVFAVFLVVFVHVVTFAQSKPLYTAPLGVQAFSFRKSFPNSVEKTLDTIKMFGFTAVLLHGSTFTPGKSAATVSAARYAGTCFQLAPGGASPLYASARKWAERNANE